MRAATRKPEKAPGHLDSSFSVLGFEPPRGRVEGLAIRGPTLIRGTGERLPGHADAFCLNFHAAWLRGLNSSLL